MMLLVGIFFAGLGAIVGSFLNVLVLRKGVATLTGRSHCPSCGKQIAAYDMVPVVSWILLRARCRECGSSISWQYPLVEALTASFFLCIGIAEFPSFLFSVQSMILLVLELLMAALLMAITVYDFRHTIIPDEWAYTFAGCALLASFSVSPSWVTLVAGPLTAFPLFMLWLVSKGTWMGLGDSKLALGIGWLLLLPQSIVAVFSSFILGSLVLVPVLITQAIVTHKREGRSSSNGLTMKSEVPFGPFLIATCLIFWFAQLYGVHLPLYLLGF